MTGMLYLSVGMPRAGSGWYYNLKHDLVVAAGGIDAHHVRKTYHLDGILSEVNCNIGALTLHRLGFVLLPVLLGTKYVIKAHAAPTSSARKLMRYSLMRTTYIYRDPRDAMLSAFENGQRARENGRQNAFSKLLSFELALKFIQEYVSIWRLWMDCGLVFTTRYEDLLTNYDLEIERLINFLKIEKSPRVQNVINNYRPEKTQNTEQQGMHFRQGKIGRFRQVFRAEQQEICAQSFGTELARMGYVV